MTSKILIDSPVTGKRESLTQAQFNSYMAQTNGAVLKWIVEPVAKHEEHDQSSHGNWAGKTVSNVQYTLVPKDEIYRRDVVKQETLRADITIKNETFKLLQTNEKYDDGVVIMNLSVKDNNGNTIAQMGTSSQFITNNEYAKITGIEVATQHQRKGIATTMLTFAREHAIDGTKIEHDRGRLSAEGKAWADVVKHQEHDQSSHGNWANSWATGARTTPDDKWLIDNFGDKTTFTRNDPNGLLRFSIPNSLIDDPRYQETIQLSLDTLEKLQDSYPLTTQVDFVEGGKTQGGFLGETFSASVDGVPAPSKIILTEDLLKPSAEKDLLVHTIVHEWGHAQDWRTPEKAKEQGNRFSQAKFEDDSIPMTDYGWYSDREAYAEAFAVKFNGAHKGGVWKAKVEQTDKWEEVFKIFELDSVKKAKGERVSFLVKDTFDANNPPVLIENYTPPVEKHAQHNQADHGNWAKGGNGLGIEAVMRLHKSSDPLQERVYDAEGTLDENLYVGGEMPIYPKRDDFKSKEDYDKAYKDYNKKWMDWAVDEQAIILSDAGKKFLDGSPAGVKKYVEDIIKQDWFIERFGDGSSLPKLSVKTANTNASGRHILKMRKDRASGRIIETVHEISIDRQFAKNERTILHEISHYATAISQTEAFSAHGVEFARNHIFIIKQAVGSARAEALTSAYIAKGIQIDN